jgi:hypothetical protein
VSRARRVLAMLSIALLSSVAPASADWLIAPFFGFTFKGETSLVDLENGAPKVHWNFGASATLIGRGPFGVEGLFLYVPHFFESDEASAVTSSNTYSLMGNVVLTTPLKWNEYGLRPYVSGGLGLMHVAQQPRIANTFPINENFLGYNVGGGATGFITDRTGLRFDLRYYNSLTRSEGTPSFGAARLRYWTGSVGVVLRY